jgi:hypothetical protein
LFEKDNDKQEKLEILRLEVAKSFEQLAEGNSTNRTVMDILK